MLHTQYILTKESYSILSPQAVSEKWSASEEEMENKPMSITFLDLV